MKNSLESKNHKELHPHVHTVRGGFSLHLVCSQEATTHLLVNHFLLNDDFFDSSRIRTYVVFFSHVYDHSLPHAWLATCDIEGE
ncbi:unnamed protein product [Spirodela intermedia]|uniref:Uncharacterized protein n=1 Tax=Spirodela intermedia TaxID=51605 RepID=A0ABN7EAY3_SPIIN|nr:unnamed protein product [Spirodela intermedia]